jgi:hypothetical protein
VLRTITRLTLAAGLALCLSLAFTPLGCGASQGVEASRHGGEGPGVPDATVSALRACADQGKDRFKETTYALHFDVEVTEDGHVDRVKRKESLPAERAMESCMADAIEGMRVPLFVVQALTPHAEAEAVSPASRGLIGNPLLLAAAAVVELVPVLVVAAGVTVIVGVSIYASEEIIETVKRRNKRKDKIKERCNDMFEVCQGMGPPCTTYLPGCGTSGLTPCGACNERCLAENSYDANCRCYSCGYE